MSSFKIRSGAYIFQTSVARKRAGQPSKIDDLGGQENSYIMQALKIGSGATSV